MRVEIDMSLAYESNTSLAFDTSVLENAGNKYRNIADDLRNMAEELDEALAVLEQSGWTTPAGTAFHEMTNTNWGKNIEKYASLLDTLDSILKQAVNEYDSLMTDYVRGTKVKL